MEIVISAGVPWRQQTINLMTESNSALTDWIVKKDIQMTIFSCYAGIVIAERVIDFKIFVNINDSRKR